MTVVRALRPLLFLLLITQAGLAAALLPGHLPVGARRPLEAGESLTVSPSRIFQQPSFGAPSHFFARERKATVLGARDNFYQLRLEADGEAKAESGWIYRSELELRAQSLRAEGDALPGDLARGRVLRIPAAGDTVSILSPVLFRAADLLGGQELLSGRQVLTVKSPENAAGFLQVRTTQGRTGWIHRTELAEERRKPR